MKVGIILIALTLAACTTGEEQAACTADAIAVPIAEAGADAASVANPTVAPANVAAQTADAPVHNQIQSDCAKLNPNN